MLDKELESSNLRSKRVVAQQSVAPQSQYHALGELFLITENVARCNAAEMGEGQGGGERVKSRAHCCQCCPVAFYDR